MPVWLGLHGRANASLARIRYPVIRPIPAERMPTARAAGPRPSDVEDPPLRLLRWLEAYTAAAGGCEDRAADRTGVDVVDALEVPENVLVRVVVRKNTRAVRKAAGNAEAEREVWRQPTLQIGSAHTRRLF